MSKADVAPCAGADAPRADPADEPVGNTWIPPQIQVLRHGFGGRPYFCGRVKYLRSGGD
jgi:hypothetical protein